MSKATGFQVPKFGLYGEHPARHQPEFVHIEKISDRSSRNDWVIKPHRHGRLFQVLFLFNGDMTVSLDDEHRQLRGNWAICIPPGTVHGFSFPIGTNGEVLTVEIAMLSDGDEQDHGNLKPMIEQARFVNFSDSDVLFMQIRQYLNLIREELGNTERFYTLALNWLVKMVLLNLKRQLENSSTIQTGQQRAKQVMLNHFRELLENHYRMHWTVKQYASALHISTSSLNRLCTEYLGITAKRAIQDRLLVEVKRRLIYTRKPIDSVAYTLGFKDPSYFSRIFKKLEGESPSDYRIRKYQETETTSII